MAHPTPLHNNAAAARSSSTASQWLLHRLGMLPVLVVLYLLFYALTIYLSGDGSSNFATAENTMNILRQVAINLVLAAGMTFVILTAGIDLSVGSVLAVSAVLGMQISLSADAAILFSVSSGSWMHSTSNGTAPASTTV